MFKVNLKFNYMESAIISHALQIKEKLVNSLFYEANKEVNIIQNS